MIPKYGAFLLAAGIAAHSASNAFNLILERTQWHPRREVEAAPDRFRIQAPKPGPARAAKDTFVVAQFNIDAWDSVAWANGTEVVYNVNENAKVTGYRAQAYDSAGWVNTDTAIFTYDAQGRLTGEEWKVWLNGAWENDARSVIQYSGDSVEVYLAQLWSLAGSWENYFRSTTRFNAAKAPVSETVEAWQPSASRWVNNNRRTTSYNGVGKPVLFLYETWISAVPAWANLGKDTLIYDGQNRLVRQISLEWDGNSTAWINFAQSEATLNPAGRPSEILFQNWSPSPPEWVNDSREQYAYDARGYDSLFTLQVWESGVWENFGRDVPRADSNGNIVESVRMGWNAGLNAWVNSQRGRWAFRRVSVLPLRPMPRFKAPFTARKLGREYHFAGLRGAARLEIRDLSGKRVDAVPVRDGSAFWRPRGKVPLGLLVVPVGGAFPAKVLGH